MQLSKGYGILVRVAPPTCSWASSSSSSVCNPLVTVILPTLAIPFAAGIGVIVASSSCLTNWIRPASTQIFGARGRHLQCPAGFYWFSLRCGPLRLTFETAGAVGWQRAPFSHSPPGGARPILDEPGGPNEACRCPRNRFQMGVGNHRWIWN